MGLVVLMFAELCLLGLVTFLVCYLSGYEIWKN